MRCRCSSRRRWGRIGGRCRWGGIGCQRGMRWRKPSVGWLDLYLKFTERQESPAEFHLWAGIAALGHVLGRRVWLDRFEGGKIYPAQIMVVIVSESAVAR